MSRVVVTLGGVTFQDFEVPEEIVLGGAQRLAVQSLIGGGRVVDVLGSDDAEISFAGICSGPDAASRAQTIDAMRAAGAVIPLFWDAFYFNVVIAEFTGDYRKSWWIPFTLRCVVASDPALAAPVLPVTQLVANDLAFAAGLSSQAGLLLTGLTPPSAAGIGAAQTLISNAISGDGLTLNDGVTSLNAAPDVGSGVAAVNQLAACSASLAAASVMSGYVGRAASNFIGQF
jgi:hypothetical protein